MLVSTRVAQNNYQVDINDENIVQLETAIAQLKEATKLRRQVEVEDGQINSSASYSLIEKALRQEEAAQFNVGVVAACMQAQ
jgi:hypothetical protein